MSHFFLTLSLAWRNLGRNKRRTASTLLSIMVGLVGLAFLDGFVSYSLWGLRETIIRSGTGHLQLATSAASFDEAESDPFPFMFPDTKALVKQLRRLPEVKDVVAALSFTGVLSASGHMESVLVKSLPAEQIESNLSFLKVLSGQPLHPGDRGRLMLGQGLAAKMHLKPGDRASLFAVGQGGGVNNQSFEVSALVSSTVAAADAVSLFMDLEDAQALLGTAQVPQLIVFLEHSEDAEPLAARLNAHPLSAAGAGTVVQTWRERSPYFQQASTSYSMVLSVARLIVLIVALFSIAGTLSLSVLERLREVGTLRSFGTKKSQILTLFLGEGLFLGLLGAVLGTALGWGLTELANALGGLALPAQPGMSEALTIYFRPDPAHFAANAVFVLAAALLGSFLPGFFSTRRVTAELLRAQ